ncbi:hypothetical protein M2459_000065 [Parabacteroides sp. PF5-5]|uniref:hypothetical protein n=1 Tax=Parabacteroides sp. PH5-16 TaxID=2940625 RepID=UPI00247607A9|nr:hypothetical protein [Parabacteroides sp. PH5-16]MDH6303733.1 hypothetical protein [Parabacteroides sp. PH5-39]MDH6314350.1 hypothetical protein [Parabacteroides sp. PF5-13]MDH6318585.1 hypothetical protein [Parabacteroides sp. PH5-13]MDH6322122.1 hypothetical protein [Parabacteroides sp. PH5-8]MDH6325798.1 hypothetical protein [Parabacteroides sp. PH5-41]MDH6333339.1 hypothetical protein [Parabacteroides sp. PF5-5]MDH6344663.1 hypothetical protein [Parabacteroides sp. PH5-46]MDH6375025.
MVAFWDSEAIEELESIYNYYRKTATLRIVYQIENNNIYIAAIWDVRQEPSKLKKIIR